MGVLLLLLAWGNLDTILFYGLYPDSAFMLVFAALLSYICLSVAIGRTRIWTDK